MPYNSQGAYSLLPGTYGQPNTTIKSDPYNAQVDDFAAAINTTRPVSAGGTGASNPSQARENLGAIQTSDVDAMFVGVVVPFPVTVPPSGWLFCHGQAVSRVTYARLFALLGLTWGAGDGSTTFNLPDLRGMFVRGWDNGRGVDTGRVFASQQSDDLGPHSHSGVTSSAGSHQHNAAVETNFTAGNDLASGAGYGQGTGSVQTTLNGAHTHTLIVNPSGGDETRPRNVAMNFCIKF